MRYHEQKVRELTREINHLAMIVNQRHVVYDKVMERKAHLREIKERDFGLYKKLAKEFNTVA